MVLSSGFRDCTVYLPTSVCVFGKHGVLGSYFDKCLCEMRSVPRVYICEHPRPTYYSNSLYLSSILFETAPQSDRK